VTFLDFIAALGNIAAFALTVLVAVVLLQQIVSRLLFARIEIRDFEGPKDHQAVSGMSEIVRSELLRLADEGAGMSLFFLNGPDKALDLPKDIKTTHLDLLAQVISWLPGRIATVTGRLQPQGGHGLGITITLQGGSNRNRGSTTIWETDLGLKPPSDATPGDTVDTERYQRLAIAAAAWIAYRFVEHQAPRARLGLLSQDWLSFALFMVGSRMHAQGVDADKLRHLYQLALARDPSNRGALFGIGLVFADDHANRPAVDFFDACADEVRVAYTGEDEWERDRLWYRAKLNGAITRLNEVSLRRSRRSDNANSAFAASFPDTESDNPDTESDNDLCDQARKSLDDVARTADRTIGNLVGVEPAVRHGRYADLVRFLVNMRDYAIVAHQTTGVVKPESPR
jgi:hypothetical protein